MAGRLVFAIFALSVIVAAALDRALSLEDGPHLSNAMRGYSIALLRAALDGNALPEPPTDRSLGRRLVAPLVVAVYQDGREMVRVSHSGTLGHALGRAARDLGSHASELDRSAIVRVEVPTSRAPLIDQMQLLAISLVAGEDGLGVEVRGKIAVATKWDLIGRHLYDRQWINEKLQFEMGLGVNGALALITQGLGMTASELEEAPRSIFRFRSHTIIEGKRGRPLGGSAEIGLQGLDRPRLIGAALGAARWCQAVLDEDGRYAYLYDPIANEEDEGARYSLPRHNGTTYFLAQTYRYTRAKGLDAAARRALDWLVRKNVRRCGPSERRCVRDSAVASLGSSALGLVAMAEYRHATGDRRFDDKMRAIGQFIREMQKPNGDFHHRYSRTEQAPIAGQLLYYTGEAVLALLKVHEELGDPRDLRAARRGLDFLTGPGWDFALSPYFFGEEHWTCIAANEAYPRIKSRRYLDFCNRFAAFRRASQYRHGETAFDSDGAYGFGAIVVPRTTPAGSTTEAMVSTALLNRKWGHGDRAIEEQVQRAVGFLLRHQLGPEAEHLFPEPTKARGGFPSSAVDLTIRIDYTQHCGSAILRSTDLLR